jgi:MobA/VirD2-like, nuclease domain
LAVVIKGKSVAGARRLAVHLMRTDTNERAEVKEVRGVVAEDLRGALLEMEAVGAGARTSKSFYHGNINTRADERLTDEQRMHAIDRLEEKLGLSGQPRVVVVHEKEGREHCHVVWSRIDLERMAAVSDSHNYRKHEEVARDLEREFGHERVQGAHVERDGKARPERTPSHAEMLQGDRTGLSAQQVKEQITALWRNTDTGQSFALALWDHGFVLARGDRRDFVVIDPSGGTHSLARRIEGAKVKDIRERMSDLDPGQLYNIKDAKQIQKARLARDASRTQEPARDAAQHSGKERTSENLGETVKVSGRTAPASRAADGVINGMANIAGGLASLVENLLGGAPEPQPLTPQEIAAAEHRAAEAEKIAHRDELAAQSTETLTKRRQELLRQFGREIQNDLENDRDPGRDRGRSR